MNTIHQGMPPHHHGQEPGISVVEGTAIEEQIICYADKFFSKNGNKPEEKSLEQIVHGLRRYGPDKVKRFQSWVVMFEN